MLKSCFVLLGVALMLSGCSSQKPADQIIGRWQDTAGTSLAVEFSKDGKMVLTDKRNQPRTANYTLVGDDKIDLPDAHAEIPTMTFKVSFSAGQLTMSDFQSDERLISFDDGKLLDSFPPGEKGGGGWVNASGSGAMRGWMRTSNLGAPPAKITFDRR